ncbi:MAG: hypothetical protein U1E78_02450 [Gammaproteobacteria bacterium]
MPAYIPSGRSKRPPKQAQSKPDDEIWRMTADENMLSAMNDDPFLQNYLKDWEARHVGQGHTPGVQNTKIDLERIHNISIDANPVYIQSDSQDATNIKELNLKVPIIRSQEAVTYLREQLSDIKPDLLEHLVNNLHQQGLTNVSGNYLGSKMIGCTMERVIDQINISRNEDGSVTIQTYSLLNNIKDRFGSGDPEHPKIYKNANPKQPLARVDMEVRLSADSKGGIKAEIESFKVLGSGKEAKHFFEEKLSPTPQGPEPSKSRPSR